MDIKIIIEIIMDNISEIYSIFSIFNKTSTDNSILSYFAFYGFLEYIPIPFIIRHLKRALNAK